MTAGPVAIERVDRVGVDEHGGVGEVGEVRVGDRERHRRVDLVDRPEIAGELIAPVVGERRAHPACPVSLIESMIPPPWTSIRVM